MDKKMNSLLEFFSGYLEMLVSAVYSPLESSVLHFNRISTKDKNLLLKTKVLVMIVRYDITNMD